MTFVSSWGVGNEGLREEREAQAEALWAASVRLRID